MTLRVTEMTKVTRGRPGSLQGFLTGLSASVAYRAAYGQSIPGAVTSWRSSVG